MPGSKVPGAWGAARLAGSIHDGTAALFPMPGGGPVGLSAHAGAAAARHNTAQAQAAIVDWEGLLIDARIKPARARTIERGTMTAVRGIVVHQTGAATARSTLESYANSAAHGAHFLIDKDGTIYQTASLTQRTRHVGKLRARCLAQQTCPPADLLAYKRYDPSGMHRSESRKSVPDRYPSNDDSIGIEIVGAATSSLEHPLAEAVYEAVTDAQNESLKWLVGELTRVLSVPMTEIFRHPEVSYKNPPKREVHDGAKACAHVLAGRFVGRKWLCLG